jgi:hypothetical protein
MTSPGCRFAEVFTVAKVTHLSQARQAQIQPKVSCSPGSLAGCPLALPRRLACCVPVHDQRRRG